MPEIIEDLEVPGNCDQPSEVSPRSGKILKNDPPANKMIKRIANRNPQPHDPPHILRRAREHALSGGGFLPRLERLRKTLLRMKPYCGPDRCRPDSPVGGLRGSRSQEECR